MICLSWHCRGLRNLKQFEPWNEKTKNKCPHLVLLIERATNFENCFAIDCVGRSRGLAVLWEQHFDVQILSFTNWHINLLAQDKQYVKEWLLTGFYGHLETLKSVGSWSFLKELNPTPNFPWFCFGDSNEITHQGEKLGVNLRPSWQMNQFQDVLNHCDLCSIPSFGQKFTWVNNI